MTTEHIAELRMSSNSRALNNGLRLSDDKTGAKTDDISCPLNTKRHLQLKNSSNYWICIRSSIYLHRVFKFPEIAIAIFLKKGCKAFTSSEWPNTKFWLNTSEINVGNKWITYKIALTKTREGFLLFALQKKFHSPIASGANFFDSRTSRRYELNQRMVVIL